MNKKYFNLFPYTHFEISQENICLYDLLNKSMISIEESLRELTQRLVCKEEIDTQKLNNKELHYLEDLAAQKFGYWKNVRCDPTPFYSKFGDSKYSTISKKIALNFCEILLDPLKKIEDDLIENIIIQLSNLNCETLKISVANLDNFRINKSFIRLMDFIEKRQDDFKVVIQTTYSKELVDFVKKYPTFSVICIVSSENEKKAAKKILNISFILYKINNDNINWILKKLHAEISSNSIVFDDSLVLENKKLLSEYVKNDASYLYGLASDQMTFNENINHNQFGKVKVDSQGNIILENGELIGNCIKEDFIKILSSDTYIKEIYRGKRNSKICYKCSYRLGCLLNQKNIDLLKEFYQQEGTLCGKR